MISFKWNSDRLYSIARKQYVSTIIQNILIEKNETKNQLNRTDILSGFLHIYWMELNVHILLMCLLELLHKIHMKIVI